MRKNNIVLSALILILILSGCSKNPSPTSVDEAVADKEKIDFGYLLSPKGLFDENQKGIDFIIVDNKNSYLLELDFDDKFLLTHLINNSALSFPAVLPEIDKNPKLRRFISSDEDSELVIQLHQTECFTANKQKLNFSVAVDIIKTSTGQTKTYYGCGDYVPDYNLHGKYRIIEFQGNELKREDFVHNFPVFEMNIIEKYLVGSDGCNSISANFSVEHKSIRFGPFLSTLMSCGQLGLGEEITSFLDNQTFTYFFEDEHRLTLLKDDKVVLVLHRIE